MKMMYPLLLLLIIITSLAPGCAQRKSRHRAGDDAGPAQGGYRDGQEGRIDANGGEAMLDGLASLPLGATLS